MESLRGLSGVNRVDQISQDGYSTLEMILSEESVLSSVITEFNAQGLRIRNMQKREPTLEDVFVELVGARMEEVEHAEASEG